jgi:drug/metabolite transporter (DMT)-like permease
MMKEWYFLSIMALVLMGTQRFLYKVSAERNYPTAWTTFSFMATVTLISVLFFLFVREPVLDHKMLWLIALWNSVAFVLGTITHIEALKHIPSSIAYPVIRLNMVLVILFSIFCFGDRFTHAQVAGMGIASLVIVLLTRDAGKGKGAYGNVKKGLILVFLSLFFGAMASISSKFAALYTNKLGFMALSYCMGSIFAFGLAQRTKTREGMKHLKEAMVIGILMGFINFAGFYAFLAALSSGPLSLVITVTGMHFAVAVLLSVIVYKEKIAFTQAIAIVLTMVSVFFLRS